MKNTVISLDLDYNVTFRNGFDLGGVDLDPITETVAPILGRYDGSGGIYGAGASGQVLYEALNGKGVDRFYDLAPNKTEFCGLPSVHPHRGEWGAFVIIAVSPSNYLSVLKTLRSHIPDETDIIFPWAFEFFDPITWMSHFSGEVELGGSPVDTVAGDRRGTVRFKGGRVLRDVGEQEYDFYGKLMADPEALQGLMDKGLVKTWRAMEAGDGLILEHKPLVRHSGENWTLSQFKDAALFYLDWWEYLTTEGYSLQDCHTSNILFDGGRPQFVDFCSIGPGEAATVSMAFLSQYFDNWIAPLALIKENQHQMFRELLLRRLSLKEVKPLCGETMVQELDDLFDRGADSFAAKDLIGFIKTMRNWIRTVDIRDSTYGWNNETYQRADLGESGPRNSKEEIVAGLMDRFNPGSFLDLGCNKGRFSLFALQRGAEVLALDMAESLLDKLYRYAKETGLPLLSLYWDLSRLAGFDKPAKTFDMVAYLALVHHLVFTAGMTVEQVVRQANSLCGSVLLFEYIKPDPDEPFVYNNYVPERHPDYSPEGFHALLGQRFDSVETYDISPTRKLFVASR